MTEREYRRLERDSYSTFKDFMDSRRKYYRKHVQGLDDDDDLEDSSSIKFGNLLDCLLFSPQEFESRFVIADFNVPTGQMLDFCNALWKRTKESTTEEGRVTREFVSLCEEAFNDVAFDSNGNRVAFKQKGMNLQKVIERFQVEGANYYEHLRNSNGRTVIEAQDQENAEQNIRELRSNFATRDIINTVTSETKTVYNQLVILWEYRGVPMKSMLDKVIVNHEEKKIYIYDLKTAWNVDGFYYNYLKLRYYAQVACYNGAIIHWAQEQNLQDYEIVPMRFIVVDPFGQYNPLVYETTQEHLREAVHGFIANGKKYAGIREAADELKWCKRMGLWNISRANYEKEGLVTLNYKQ